MASVYFFTTFLFTLISSVFSTEDACDIHRLRACAAKTPELRLWRRAEARLRAGGRLGISPAAMDGACREWSRHQAACLDSLRQCPTARRAEFHRRRQLVHYACNVRKDITALRSLRCTAGVDPDVALRRCWHAAFTQHAQAFNSITLDDRVCPYLRAVRACPRQALTGWCGPRAARVLAPLLELLYREDWRHEDQMLGCAAEDGPQGDQTSSRRTTRRDNRVETQG